MQSATTSRTRKIRRMVHSSLGDGRWRQRR
jgi:hypothetical protein